MTKEELKKLERTLKDKALRIFEFGLDFSVLDLELNENYKKEFSSFWSSSEIEWWQERKD